MSYRQVIELGPTKEDVGNIHGKDIPLYFVCVGVKYLFVSERDD